jgi:hypothetical protein
LIREPVFAGLLTVGAAGRPEREKEKKKKEEGRKKEGIFEIGRSIHS